jgi:hypothetical protein
MQALLQRLKELNPKAFEQFCFHLLKERYPGVDIHRVDGSAGDDGVDLFSGHLENACVVWQCKAFSGAVGKSQKEQIKESLRTAIRLVKPARWVLCINVDLDIATHRWWIRVKESYSEQVAIDLLSASELAHQLIFRRTLREAFFPQVLMDVAQIRAAISQSTHLSKEDLTALATDNVAQLTDRLNDLGPDFAYEVTFRSNTGPLLEPSRAGVLLTIQNDDRIINVFARDPEHLKRNPPKGQFTLKATTANRLIEMIDKGKPFDAEPGEILTFSSDFDFLLPDGVAPVTEWRLSIQQTRQAFKEYLFRLTFGKGPEAITYDLVKFHIVSVGQKEATLRSTTNLPFAINLTISLTGDATSSLQLSEQLTGFNAAELYRGVTAAIAMMRSGELDIHDLETGKRFLRIHAASTVPEWMMELAQIAKTMLRVSEFYGVDLVWPPSISETDLSTLQKLDELIDGTPVPITNIRSTLVKTFQLPSPLLRDCCKSGSFAFDHSPSDSVSLFGVQIVPGPLRITITNGLVRHCARLETFLRRAPVGASIDIQIACPFGAIATAIPRERSIAH